MTTDSPAQNTASIWYPGETILPTANASNSYMSQKFIVSTVPESVFTITSFVYATGTGSLLVELNGVAQFAPDDYTETSNSSITLTTPAIVGDQLVIRGLVGVLPVTSAAILAQLAALANLNIPNLPLSLTNGGTGASTAAGARADLVVPTVGVAGLDQLTGIAVQMNSAGTINLDSATAEWIQINGTTGPITTLTLGLGKKRTLYFASTPIINNSGNIVLPVGQYQCGAGDVIEVISDSVGVTRITKITTKSGQSMGGPFGITSYIFASTSVTFPESCVSATVTAIGGGSSGSVGSVSTDPLAATAGGTYPLGGAAGGMCIKTFTGIGNLTATITIGAGGASVTGSAQVNGNAGGNTQVILNSITLTANGGTRAPNASGGAATGGDINLTGASPNIPAADISTAYTISYGATGLMYPAIAKQTSAITAPTALNYGAGGNGAKFNAPAASTGTSGAGSPGLVILQY